MQANRTSPAPLLRVAAVQMKFAPTIPGNLAQIKRGIVDAVRQRADVILFPECATTGYTYDFSTVRRSELLDALEEVSALAASHHVNVLVGSPAFCRGKLLNCLVVFDRTGRLL